jgi:hypothetical protein
MRFNNYVVFLLIHFLSINCILAQQNTIQPKIMVIPFTKSGEEMLESFESNQLQRLVISRVKTGFETRNFPTVDFVSSIKMINNDNVMEIENQTSIKQQLIEISSADIYVEVETTINRSSGGNSVTIILSAYDAYTSMTMSNETGVSDKFYTESFEKLALKKADEMMDNFLNSMKSRFEDIKENGKSIFLNIGIKEGTDKDMDYTIENGESLSEKIESWVEKNAFKGIYHIQGVTKTKMIFNEIRIPVKNLEGNNYKTSQFVSSFRKYLASIGIDTERDIQGNRIFISVI